ncbi:hypothetical protein MHK74_00210 [Microbacterium aurum]|uniref:hypothetical protein n=1 Tax=Microbacterium aurum TaxID=36805 RepID=UPI001EF3DC58|nr:hypothetical protein [Microbacterium aurum]MCG7413030.1 hypothetical protein [Microbacterium aurum]
MGSDTETDLRDAAEARAAHRRLGTQLGAAETAAAARRAEEADLAARLRVEEADVRRLEGVSPSRLWATLRGDLDERAARDRAEWDAAALAVAGAMHRREQAESEVVRLAAERTALGDVEARYAAALAAHERAVRSAGTGAGAAAAELGQIAQGIGVATAEQREIDEAVTALRAASAALEEAFGHLQSAGGWSTYDTFFGGGMVADLMKHSRIDDSAKAFARVNRALERLRIELADIGVTGVQGVEISDTLAVFDVLFDNVFSDWMVRDRIARAREEATRLRVRLSELERTLAERRLAVAEHLVALARRREELLLAG